MHYKKILIMGLPGSGKTTLANKLALELSAVHFNADAVRENINKDLGFSIEDRIEQATRMGWLCDQVVAADHYVIADFVCPLISTRLAFGENAFIIWMNTISVSRYQNTNSIFEYPSSPNIIIAEMKDDNVYSILKQILNQC